MLERLQGALKLQDPPMAFRFGVFFFFKGIIPNPIDIRFQKVSGLSAAIETSSTDEGKANLSAGYRFPEKVTYENLRLERGLTLLSPLNIELDKAMTQLKLYPSDVLVILFDESNLPFSAWLFRKAYPVKWSLSDFDANASQIVVESMELAYSQFKPIRL
ncbi:phage tail protein [Fulvivirgaceae bacterium PWU4]|uniref:Phage tail protein n=1 Tax=Chryseosolibacter histidini TaxID=2782349 RepID=A0AAP2DML5_9BACT|nr:phage tail protein [Chryseosolibacter histidini]MBT1699056.1 phage tail protein [Chryseosolibacter histidini]